MPQKSVAGKKAELSSVVTGPPPDRSHCPPDGRVRAYADGKIQDDKSLADHVAQCPWCAAEFKDHARDLEWNRFLNLSTWLSILVILVIVITAVLRSHH
jgi:hypothetical protein